MRNLLTKIKNQPKSAKILLILVLIFILTAAFLPPAARADISWVQEGFGSILGWIISGISTIIVIAVDILIAVAQYNNFINENAVLTGWTVARDMANMFVVVGLLVIAFATILNIQKYNYKTTLYKLLSMAVLINFSKAICGIIIDASQVVMLTFVNAFKLTGGGNFLTALHLTEFMNAAPDASEFTSNSVIIAYILGVIVAIVALVVIVVLLFTLIMRVVMLWFYIIYSPLAFIARGFPGAEKYFNDWWGKFIKQVIVGPAMAFFLWLSLSATSVKDGGISSSMVTINAEKSISAGGQISQIGQAPNLFSYMITIGMFMGTLVASQMIGAAAAGMAGAALGKMKSIGTKVARMPDKLAWRGFEKTQIPAASRAAYAGLGRTSVGKFLGLTKEGREKDAKDREMKWMGRLGGEKGEAEANEYNAKIAADRITVAGQANKINTMDPEQLRNFSGSKDARTAATMRLAQLGGLEEKDANLVNDALKNAPQELKVTIEDAVKKNAPPELARETVYKMPSGDYNLKAIAADIKNGKVGADVFTGMKKGDLTTTQQTEFAEMGEQLVRGARSAKDIADIFNKLPLALHDAFKQKISSDTFKNKNGEFDAIKASNFATGSGYLINAYKKNGSFDTTIQGLDANGEAASVKELLKEHVKYNTDSVSKNASRGSLEDVDIAGIIAENLKPPQIENLINRSDFHKDSFKKGLSGNSNEKARRAAIIAGEDLTAVFGLVATPQQKVSGIKDLKPTFFTKTDAKTIKGDDLDILLQSFPAAKINALNEINNGLYNKLLERIKTLSELANRGQFKAGSNKDLKSIIDGLKTHTVLRTDSRVQQAYKNFP